MIIQIPLEVPSQNVTDRMHHMARHRLKQTWALRIKGTVLALWKAKETRKMAVTIHSYRTRRITDHANLVGGCKMVIDAIRDAGLIVDDSDKWMVATYNQDVASKSPTGGPCTVINIEPWPEVA